jgi:hypothetical protein
MITAIIEECKIRKVDPLENGLDCKRHGQRVLNPEIKKKFAGSQLRSGYTNALIELEVELFVDTYEIFNNIDDHHDGDAIAVDPNA